MVRWYGGTWDFRSIHWRQFTLRWTAREVQHGSLLYGIFLPGWYVFSPSKKCIIGGLWWIMYMYSCNGRAGWVDQRQKVQQWRLFFLHMRSLGMEMVWIFRCQPQVGTAAYQADLRSWLPIVPQVTTSPSRPPRGRTAMMGIWPVWWLENHSEMEVLVAGEIIKKSGKISSKVCFICGGSTKICHGGMMKRTEEILQK